MVFTDIKMSSILLGEDYITKLFDFSLSASIPEGETHLKDDVKGTYGFIALKYLITCIVKWEV